MGVTKTQLRDFIDLKISKRKLELYSEIEASVIARLGEALRVLLGDVSELESVASRFEDLLTEKIHLVGASSVPSYATTAANQANGLCKTNKYFLNNILTDAMNDITNPRSYLQFRCKPLLDVFNQLNKELSPKISLYRDGLTTLKNELNNAISNETTGKRAYNALIALGVDMSDLPDANPNLPAIVKLSVDVCVMNGNC